MMAPSRLVLVGGGGFTEEIAEYLLYGAGAKRSPRVLGVVDDFTKEPVSVGSLPFLGRIVDVAPNDDLGFVVCPGVPRFRREYTHMIREHGGRLATVIHSSAIIASNAKIGDGSVICPYAIVNAGATIGCCAVLNVHTSVAHGAAVGEFSVLCPYAAVNGWARVGADCFLATRATIHPKVIVGDRCTVDAHSFVKADVGDRTFVSVRGIYKTAVNRLEKP